MMLSEENDDDFEPGASMRSLYRTPGVGLGVNCYALLHIPQQYSLDAWTLEIVII